MFGARLILNDTIFTRTHSLRRKLRTGLELPVGTGKRNPRPLPYAHTIMRTGYVSHIYMNVWLNVYDIVQICFVFGSEKEKLLLLWF